MTHVIGGAIAIVMGIMGIIGWWDNFGDFLRGCVPLILLIGGLAAVGIGMQEKEEKKEN
ncbi:MAG: hypothetical protein HQL29_03390 [Candidatus Omnitrophica bacterium]|nr:hypothetical protein [Candidatus Omnitrophota bacterium]